MHPLSCKVHPSELLRKRPGHARTLAVQRGWGVGGRSGIAIHSPRPTSSSIELLIPPRPVWSQSVQQFLVNLVQVGSGDYQSAALLLPTLRTEDALLQNLIALCYHWVANGQQILMSLSILAAFASACNSADLPADRSTVVMIRSRSNFRFLLQASLAQVCASGFRSCRSVFVPARSYDARFILPQAGAGNPSVAVVLGRFWDAVLGTPPQSLLDAQALSTALTELVNARELESSMTLLLNALQGRAAEPLAGARFVCEATKGCQ